MSAAVVMDAPAAPLVLRWEAPPGGYDPQYPGCKVCWFDLDGRRYFAKRAADGQIVRLSKRERSNGRGVYFSPLALNGRAAKRVLAAMAQAVQP